MMEKPLNEGQETVAAFQMDLQRFADDAGDAGGSVDSGGGVADTGTDDSSADESGSNIIVGDTGDDEATSGDVDQNSEEDVPGAVKGQSAEANKAFAEMRKQKEAAEKAVAKAREGAKVEAQRERDAWYVEKFGMNEQQYKALAEIELQQRQAKQRQEQSELPKKIFNDLVAQGYDPKVAQVIADSEATKIELQQLKQQQAADKRQQAEQSKQQQQEALKQKMGKQIVADHEALKSKYGELIPAITEMDDETVALMRQGIPLKAAWLTAHEDDVAEFHKNNGAKKMAKNVNSKAHLQSEKSGSGSFGKEVDLSPEQLRVWKAMGYNDKEARKRAAKYMKQGK